jgi:hypothetical protein
MRKRLWVIEQGYLLCPHPNTQFFETDGLIKTKTRHSFNQQQKQRDKVEVTNTARHRKTNRQNEKEAG